MRKKKKPIVAKRAEKFSASNRFTATHLRPVALSSSLFLLLLARVRLIFIALSKTVKFEERKLRSSTDAMMPPTILRKLPRKPLR